MATKTIPQILRELVDALGKQDLGWQARHPGIMSAVKAGEAALKRNARQTKQRVKAAVKSGKAGRPSSIPEKVRMEIATAPGTVREIREHFMSLYPVSCGNISENTIRYIRASKGGRKKDAQTAGK